MRDPARSAIYSAMRTRLYSRLGAERKARLACYVARYNDVRFPPHSARGSGLGVIRKLQPYRSMPLAGVVDPALRCCTKQLQAERVTCPTVTSNVAPLPQPLTQAGEMHRLCQNHARRYPRERNLRSWLLSNSPSGQRFSSLR